MEKCQSVHYPHLSFKYLVKSVIVKSIIELNNNFWGSINGIKYCLKICEGEKLIKIKRTFKYSSNF